MTVDHGIALTLCGLAAGLAVACGSDEAGEGRAAGRAGTGAPSPAVLAYSARTFDGCRYTIEIHGTLQKLPGGGTELYDADLDVAAVVRCPAEQSPLLLPPQQGKVELSAATAKDLLGRLQLVTSVPSLGEQTPCIYTPELTLSGTQLHAQGIEYFCQDGHGPPPEKWREVLKALSPPSPTGGGRP